MNSISEQKALSYVYIHDIVHIRYWTVVIDKAHVKFEK